MFRAMRLILVAFAFVACMAVGEYAVRYFVCPCGASCICSPCECPAK